MANDPEPIISDEVKPAGVVTTNVKIPCRHCFEEIDPRAKVCPKCRVHQQRYIGIALTYIPGILAVFAVVSLCFTSCQLSEAKQKRIEATAAAEIATNAVAQAREAESNTVRLAKEISTFQTALMQKEMQVKVICIGKTNGEFINFSQEVDPASHNHLAGNDCCHDVWLFRDHPVAVGEGGTEKYFRDLVEAGFIRWLGEHYGLGWEKRLFGISTNFRLFGNGRLKTRNNYGFPTNSDGKVWASAEIKNQFGDNVFYDNTNTLREGAYLPPNAKVSVEWLKWGEPAKARKITIKTAQIEFSVTIAAITGSRPILLGANGDDDAVEKLGIKGNGWVVQEVYVLFNTSYSTDKLLSEQTVREQQWAEQLMEDFRFDFEWELFAADLKTATTPWWRKPPWNKPNP